MVIDMEKFRKTSSFYKLGEDYERQIILKQAIEEFDYYQKYSPNTHDVYINGNVYPIKGTMIDVSDLEVRTDSKWMLTSLENKIYNGDIVKWKDKNWMVTYDKEKNTSNCYKVKIQPCNYILKFPTYSLLDNITPMVYNIPIISMSYYIDSKDESQEVVTDASLMYIYVQINDYTKKIKELDRLWIYESAWEVTGIDYTNTIYDDSDSSGRGYLKYTVRALQKSIDLDNKELKVCDYYKYFPKEVTSIPPENNENKNLNLSFNKGTISIYDCATLTATTNPIGQKVIFLFEGNSLNCTITNITDNSCRINSKGNIGVVKIKAYVENNPTIISYINLVVANDW